MKIGFLSDAHGNPGPLEVSLSFLKAQRAESIFFLGDAVGYLPGETQVLDILREASVYCQKGNHEAMLLEEIPLPPEKDKIYRIAAARARLSRAAREFIAGWPDHRYVQIANRRLFLVHGSPANYLQGYLYPDGDLSICDGMDCDAVFTGHTHYPFVSCRQNTLVANVGSCGLPRDQGDLLSVGLYDSETNTCGIFRFPFDQKRTVEQFNLEGMAEKVHQCLFRKAPSAPFGHLVDSSGILK